MNGDVSKDEEVGKCINDLQLSLNPDGGAIPHEFVDHVERPGSPAIVCAVLKEVVGPYWIVGIERHLVRLQEMGILAEGTTVA